jgi:hypothetical protein
MKTKPSKKQKKATAARKPAGKVKMSATASGLTSQSGRPYTRSKVVFKFNYAPSYSQR